MTNFAIQKNHFYSLDTKHWFKIVVFVAYFQQQPFKRARFFGGSAAQLLQLKHYFYHFESNKSLFNYKNWCKKIDYHFLHTSIHFFDLIFILN